MKLKKIQIFHSSLYISPSYFTKDVAHCYLILQTLYYTLKKLVDPEKAVSWKSKSLSTEKIATYIYYLLVITYLRLFPSIKWYKNCLIFKASCLKQKAQLLLLPI